MRNLNSEERRSARVYVEIHLNRAYSEICKEGRLSFNFIASLLPSSRQQ